MTNQTGNTSVKERIVDDLEEVIKRIKQSNGYDVDINSVQRWEQEGNDKATIPFVLISTGPERKENRPSLVTACDLTVYLDVGTVHDKTKYPISTDQYLNRFASDIEKAVMEDYQRNGFADNTAITDIEPFGPEAGMPFIGVMVTLKIKYKHLTGDPKTNF